MNSWNKIKNGLFSLTAAAVFAAAASPASAQVSGGIYMTFGHPPAPVVERMPVAPGPGYAWHRGSWHWDGHRYRWHKGYYEHRHGYGHDDGHHHHAH
jgi:hypothetical protein